MTTTMRRAISISVFSAWWILAPASFAAEAPKVIPQAKKVCNVMGHVVDQLGRPLPGVVLTARSVDDGAGEGANDRSGYLGWFSLCVDPGELEITLSMGCDPPECGDSWRHLGHSVQRMVVEPEKEYRTTKLVLPVGGVVTGRIVDAKGEPVPWATVGAPGLAGHKVGARADESDRFRVRGDLVPVGRQAVLALHPEHGELHVWIEVEPGRNEIELRLPPPLAACGRAVDEHGEPVSGAEVVLFEIPQFLCPLSGATSGPDGRFDLAVPKAGVFAMKGRKEGYDNGQTPPFFVTGEEAPCRELVLRRDATILGRVTWDVGIEPVPIEVSYQGDSAAIDVETGRFVLRNVLSGAGLLRLSAVESTRRVSVPVEVPAGVSEVSVEVRIGRGHALVESGHDLVVRVLRSGEAVAGHAMSLKGQGPDVLWSLRTDDSGSARFVGLREGEYELDAGGPRRRTVTVPRERPVVFHLSDAALRVDVIDAEGQPVKEAEVRVERKSGIWRFESASAERATPGRFRVFSEPGPRVLTVWAPDRVPVQRVVEVAPAGETSVRVELGEGTPVSLRVGGPTGVVPSSVHLSFRADGDWIPLGSSRRPGPQGEMTVRDLPEGDLEVEVSSSGYSRARGRVVVPGPPVVFELVPKGLLEVEVTALAAEPAPVDVRLSSREGAPHPYYASDPERPLRLYSSAIFLSVDAGRWSVEVVADDGRRWRGETVVGAGADTLLRLEGPGR